MDKKRLFKSVGSEVRGSETLSKQPPSESGGSEDVQPVAVAVVVTPVRHCHHYKHGHHPHGSSSSREKEKSSKPVIVPIMEPAEAESKEEEEAESKEEEGEEEEAPRIRGIESCLDGSVFRSGSNPGRSTSSTIHAGTTNTRKIVHSARSKSQPRGSRSRLRNKS